jgi:predicted AlkP superfamily pyrophosphatase or phosphodiesterase
MQVTTIADELKLFTSGRSKVIGISLKDRGATLAAGHAADAAYWMSDRWISSSFYMEELPEWVNEFNGELRKWVPEVWYTYKPIEQYAESGPDNNSYENTFGGKESPIFPYNLNELMPENGGIQMIKTTPFGNTITTEFAKAAVINEKLGQRGEVDFLSVSYSSPDYIGHMFGPQSKELQDNYVRLDAEIAGLLSFLDEEVGVGEYLLFLTADHGAAYVPAMLQDWKIPGGYLDVQSMTESANQFLSEHFEADNWLLHYSNEQFFLNRKAIAESGRSPDQVAEQLAAFLLQQEGVAEVYTARDLRRNEYTKGVASLLQNGYHHIRSGDLMLVLEPGWLEYGRKGTTHGALWSYDTHVPALFYGKGIKPGFTDEKLSITDIAPTVCSLLRISFPNASQGNPIRVIAENIPK